MSSYHKRVALVLALTACTPASAAEPLRGMTISCPMNGRIWGTSATKTAMKELADLGVDAVAIHPYARIATDGLVTFSPAAQTDYMREVAKFANEAGMKMFWKPHLAYWGRFQWRGTIEFGTDETKWKRFFDSHEAWIIDHAKFARAAGFPMLAIGVELDRTTHREKEWRRLIANVRKVYKGKLTFASNWDSYEKIAFWDALDYVGVQAYFPISESQDPTRKDIERSWDGHLERLAMFSKKVNKPILFTEIGYNRSLDAARQPWHEKMDDNARARALRVMLMEVSIDKMRGAKFIAGAFWWKWIPGWSPWDKDFSMRDVEASDVLKRTWGAKKK